MDRKHSPNISVPLPPRISSVAGDQAAPTSSSPRSGRLPLRSGGSSIRSIQVPSSSAQVFPEAPVPRQSGSSVHPPPTTSHRPTAPIFTRASSPSSESKAILSPRSRTNKKSSQNKTNMNQQQNHPLQLDETSALHRDIQYGMHYDVPDPGDHILQSNQSINTVLPITSHLIKGTSGSRQKSSLSRYPPPSVSTQTPPSSHISIPTERIPPSSERRSSLLIPPTIPPIPVPSASSISKMQHRSSPLSVPPTIISSIPKINPLQSLSHNYRPSNAPTALGVRHDAAHQSVRPRGAPILPPISTMVKGPKKYRLYPFRQPSRTITVKSFIELLELPYVLFSQIAIVELDKNSYSLMECVMCYMTHEQIYNLLTNLLGWNLREWLSIDMCCNLLWYINHVAANTYVMLQLQHVHDLQDVIDMLGSEYDGPTDAASVIFALITQYSVPHPDARYIPGYYDIVKNYTLCQVWRLNCFYTEENTKLPPHIRLALVEKHSIVEPIILKLDEDNIAMLMEDEDMLLPKYLQSQHPHAWISYFLNEIKIYENIKIRGEHYPPPPDINTVVADNNEGAALQYYTLKELVEAYEPGADWRDRRSLIRIIFEEANMEPTWSLRNRFCNNDNTINLMQGFKHGEINKNDSHNVTLSYGRPKNYRCYQIDELLGAFGIYNGKFRFLVPDWMNVGVDVNERLGPIDTLTGLPMEEEFSEDSMNQLFAYLGNHTHLMYVNELRDKIQQGLHYKALERTSLPIRKQEYDALTISQKEYVDLYLAWLFLCAMRMRFWLGPGHPWADVRIDVSDENYIKLRCKAPKRENNILIQHRMYDILQKGYIPDKNIVNWLNILPAVRYRFQHRHIDEVYTNKTINDALLDVFVRRNCMGIGGDILIQSAYVMIMTFHPELDVTTFLNQYLIELHKLEQIAVKQLLHEYGASGKHVNKTSSGTFIKVLKEREKELEAKDIPVLYPFEPEKVEYNLHLG